MPIYSQSDYLDDSFNYIFDVKEDVTIDSDTKLFSFVKP